MATINTLLAHQGLSIVSGPGTSGNFTAELSADAVASGASAESVAAVISKDPNVTFAATGRSVEIDALKRRRLRVFVALALAAIAFVLRAPPPRRRPRCARRRKCAPHPTQFIVVAVANPVTGRPAAVGGTAHGYGTSTNYRVSATATALILRELARKYSLTLVSEWPIEQLQMHCVLFRIPPGTTREAVIEKLLQDKRVLVAQPLNEFESANLRRAAVSTILTRSCSRT